MRKLAFLTLVIFIRVIYSLRNLRYTNFKEEKYLKSVTARKALDQKCSESNKLLKNEDTKLKKRKTFKRETKYIYYQRLYLLYISYVFRILVITTRVTLRLHAKPVRQTCLFGIYEKYIKYIFVILLFFSKKSIFKFYYRYRFLHYFFIIESNLLIIKKD